MLMLRTSLIKESSVKVVECSGFQELIVVPVSWAMGGGSAVVRFSRESLKMVWRILDRC